MNLDLDFILLNLLLLYNIFKIYTREKCKESTIIKKYVMILKCIRCEMSPISQQECRGILELKIEI